MSRIWRDPVAETEDYPNLTVYDRRVSGSIVVGHSRLPLWAIIRTAIDQGWPEVEKNWPQITEDYRFSASDLSAFLYFLLRQRGEFGRLVCILADAERRDYERTEELDAPPWWEDESTRERVAAQLRTCLASVEGDRRAQ